MNETNMHLRVKEVSDLSGVSVRALHHYDSIGLLKPDQTTEAGYRLYTKRDLERLQQILFFRELGFPLKQIKQILDSPTFDRIEALELQHKMLIAKRNQLDTMILTIAKTIKNANGELQMTEHEKFAGFDFSHNPYEQEARQRWGDEAVDQSKAALDKMSQEDLEQLQATINSIYQRLADLRQSSPASPEAQAAIKEWHDFLNNNFGHHYTLEAFKGLGQMYVDDERFTKNIDQFGEGLAQFMRDAMEIFADSNQG